MINFIKQYIDNLKREDLVKLLDKQDIHLSDDELDVIYNHLKNDWYTFIYEDPNYILNNIKNNLNNDNYNKLYELYIWAKEKYSIYL